MTAFTILLVIFILAFIHSVYLYFFCEYTREELVERIRQKYANRPTFQYDEPIIDHHIHVPIQSVPDMYKEDYSRYLHSLEWRAFRKLVLKRDKYRCVDCNVKAYHSDFCPTGQRLQVHHIHYDGIETMTFTTDQCVSVCTSCHMSRHSR